MWMVALYTAYYNFIKIRKSLCVTPAMETKLMDRLWTFEDIVELMDANAPKPGQRASYNKRKAAVESKNPRYDRHCPTDGCDGRLIEIEEPNDHLLVRCPWCLKERPHGLSRGEELKVLERLRSISN